LTYFSSIGLGSTLLPGVLWSKVAAGAEITKETIACAEEIAGVSFTDEERTMMVRSLTQARQQIDALHKVVIENGTPPAILLAPVPPGVALPAKKKVPMQRGKVPVMARPGSLEELAFLTVSTPPELVRTRQVK